MQPKVELSQLRSSGEIVDDTIVFFKQNWKDLLKSYFTIGGFFWVAGIVITIFNQTRTFQLQQQNESIFTFTYFLTLFFSLINYITIVLIAFCYVALYREKGKEPPTVEEVWVYFKYYFFRVFGSSLLLTILLSIGLIFCLLPGIYFLPIFLLILAVMVLENGSFQHSFSRGFYLIKNNWWQIFGVLIVTNILLTAGLVLLSIPVIIVVALVLLLTNANQGHTILLALSFTTTCFQALYLIPAISITLAYFSFNEQKDDLAILNRIETLGIHKENINNHFPSEEY